jgi:hypothetical protein
MRKVERLRTIHAIGLVLMSGEEADLEHIKTGYRETFTSTVAFIGSYFVVDPLITSTGVEQDRNEEEVEESFAFLFDIRG